VIRRIPENQFAKVRFIPYMGLPGWFTVAKYAENDSI